MTNLNPFYSNPADAAMPYLQQIPGTISPYYQPYINAGGDALQDLIKQYGQLINNPGSVISNVGAGYQQSPGYQYQMNEGLDAANASAAAGGMLGTPYAQKQNTQVAEDIANKDYQQYLNEALGLYGAGLQGEQGVNEMGFGASKDLAGDLASNLQNEGQLAYAGTANQNASNAGVINDVLGVGTALATGGASLAPSMAMGGMGSTGAPGMSSPFGSSMGGNSMAMGGSSGAMGGMNPNMMQQFKQFLTQFFGGGGNNASSIPSIGSYF